MLPAGVKALTVGAVVSLLPDLKFGNSSRLITHASFSMVETLALVCQAIEYTLFHAAHATVFGMLFFIPVIKLDMSIGPQPDPDSPPVQAPHSPQHKRFVSVGSRKFVVT